MAPHERPARRARPDRALAVHERPQPRRRLPAAAASAFPTWEAVREAPVAEIEAAIQPGGLHVQKSRRIKEILEALPADLDLSWMREAPVDESRAVLCALPGVGRKTAACVLLFAYGLRDVPVDTHVSRVGTRLGLLRPGRAVRRAARRDAAAHAAGRGARAAREPPAPRPAHVPRAHARRAARARCGGCARGARHERAARRDRHLRRAAGPRPGRPGRSPPALAALGIAADIVAWDDPAADWAAFDLVAVRNTWDYPAAPRRSSSPGPSDVPRLVNPSPVLRWTTDKRYLVELEAAGLPVVHTTFVETPGGAVAGRPRRRSSSSRRSASGRWTPGAIATPARRRAHVAELHAAGRAAMVQPFLPGIAERGETALIYFAGAFSPRDPQGPDAARARDRPPVRPVPAGEHRARASRRPTSARSADAVVAWLAERFGGRSPTPGSTSSRARTATRRARVRAGRAVAVPRSTSAGRRGAPGARPSPTRSASLHT